MNHGQSEATHQKEGLFGMCMGWALDQFMRERRTLLQPYFGFDLNCGSGENRCNGANIIGTPLLLKRAMKKRRIPGHLLLCDKSSRALKAARTHFINAQLELFRKGSVSASFIPRNNREFVPTIPPRIREGA